MFKSYVITKTAYEDIKKLDNVTKKKLKDRLDFLMILDNPLSKAVKLPDNRQGTYRWTIGDYRVIFDVQRKKAIILRVQHRRDVYWILTFRSVYANIEIVKSKTKNENSRSTSNRP